MSQAQLAHSIPPLPPTSTNQSMIKPLFPAAAAVNDNQSQSESTTKTKIEPVSAGTKIIHPDEDISLVSVQISIKLLNQSKFIIKKKNKLHFTFSRRNSELVIKNTSTFHNNIPRQWYHHR